MNDWEEQVDSLYLIELILCSLVCYCVSFYYCLLCFGFIGYFKVFLQGMVAELPADFGYRSLQKNFEPTNREEPRKPHLTVQEPTERKERPDTGYQLVPPSRSSIHEKMILHKCRIPLVQWQTPSLVQPMN